LPTAITTGSSAGTTRAGTTTATRSSPTRCATPPSPTRTPGTAPRTRWRASCAASPRPAPGPWAACSTASAATTAAAATSATTTSQHGASIAPAAQWAAGAIGVHRPGSVGQDDQIVAVDYLALVLRAQAAGQPPGGASHQAGDLGGVVADQAAGDDRAVLTGQVHGVAGLKGARDAGDAGRQQGRAALDHGCHRPRVEHQRAPGDGGVREPQQPGRRPLPGRREVRPDRLSFLLLRRPP